MEVSGGAFGVSLSEDILEHSGVGDDDSNACTKQKQSQLYVQGVESREASPDGSSGSCTPPNCEDHVSKE